MLTPTAVSSGAPEVDLYAILGVSKSASKAEIRKAYHKVALSSHPDKVPEHERDQAETKFKAASQAYEILFDDEKRHLYDTHGMAAFDPSSGGGHAEANFEDILQFMFGMNDGPFADGPRRRGPRKDVDEEQEYEVTLEELYKGKTAKFAITKSVVCSHCKGSGGKEKAKPKECAMCHGKGTTIGLRSIGPGIVTQEMTTCSNCKGAGTVFKERDKCRKCKGARVTEENKMLEIYVERGARDGDRIVLAGEADQTPDREPGDLIFTLKEADHDVFTRAGADLQASIEISLAEALCGLDRVVIKHLDGRGIHIRQPPGKILRPEQVLKIPGEGMPIKKSDARGDLYLVINVQFPEEDWAKDKARLERIQQLLPQSDIEPIAADIVDEVDFQADADLEQFGVGSGDPRGGPAWVDEDDEAEGQPQCAQQ